MNTDIKDWIESTLIEQDRFTFERLGPKRELFRVVHRAPLPCMFIDAPPEVPIVWMRCAWSSLMDSFFERLTPVVEKHDCAWFFVSMPQEEYTILRWI